MKSLKLNYIFSILKAVMTIAFPIISFPYASRVLGVYNIGIVSYCVSVISYFTLFASLGVAIYATREGAKVKNNRDELTKLSREVFIINLISTGVVYAVFLVMILLGFFDGYIITILICSLAIWFQTLSIEWLYQIKEEFVYISTRTMIFQIISLVVLFVFVRSRDAYNYYAVIQVLAGGGAFVFNLKNSRKYVNLLEKTSLDLKKHIKPIFTIFGVSAASSIYLNLDTVMLGIIHTKYEVGLYTAAVKLTMVIRQIAASINIVAVSRLSYFASKDNGKEYNRLLKFNFDLILFIVTPCIMGMIMLSEPLILLFSGKEFVSADNASIILSINTFFAVSDGLIYNQMLIPNSMDRQAFIGTSAGAFGNIILNALLIPGYGINGAAVATLISEFVVFSCFTVALRKKYNFVKLYDEVPKYLLACIAIIIPCLIVRRYVNNLFVVITLCMVSSGLGYIISLVILKNNLVLNIMEQVKGRLGGGKANG